MALKLLNKRTKMTIYRAYGCETWAMTKKDEAHLKTFERRILQEEEGTWRIRRNGEINKVNVGHYIQKFVRSQRLS